MSRRSIARSLGTACALAAVLLLTACGEYSPIDDDATSTDASSSPSADSTPTPAPVEDEPTGGDAVASFTWGLPPSDTSVKGNDGPAYGALLRGCGSARAFLSQIDLDDLAFWGLTNPRIVAFYSAGLAIECNGDMGLARAWTEGALATYGLAGTDRPGDPGKPDGSGEPVESPGPPGYGEPECDLYRTLVSVLRQVPPDSLQCQGGSPPPFRSQVYETADGPVLRWDDPCTFDVDESTIAPASAADATPTFCVPVATPPRSDGPDDDSGDDGSNDGGGNDDGGGDDAPTPTESPPAGPEGDQ